jgi:hypothetical protein
VSYNFAKSSDLGSDDQSGLYAATLSQVQLPPLTPSDFDIRNSFAGAVSYEVPAPHGNRAANAILRNWALDGLVRVSSAPPINVITTNASLITAFNVTQADVVPNQPIWIADPTQPAGRSLNPAAFVRPAVDKTGNFPRNGLRSPYSVDQTDLAVRRRFNLTDRFNLNVRAEYFNVFNHPMFGAPGANEPETHLGFPNFGQVDPGSTTNLALGGGGSQGGQSFQYALGGPRSAQFTIKLQFWGRASKKYNPRSRQFPKRESRKNKSRINGMFFAPKKRPSKHHVSPAFHHKFTIKKPRSATRLAKNPSKNTEISSQKKFTKLWMIGFPEISK